MTCFPLRLAFNFLVCIGIGLLLLPILDNVPMLNDAATTNKPTPVGYFLLVFIPINLLGAADGWFNRTTNQDLRIKRATWSCVVAASGAIIGVLWGAWPLSTDDASVRISQVCAVAFDFLIFFFLPHIGGNDAWKKHHRLATKNIQPAN